jgi:hypothetical protein
MRKAMTLKTTVLRAAVAAVLLTASSIMAADVFVTATVRPPGGNGQIVKVDVTPPFTPASCTARTGSPDCIIPLLTTPTPVDSLVLDTSGRFIYSLANANEARRFDPTQPLSPTNPLLLANSAVGALNFPQDMILSPDGGTLYTANFLGNNITLTNMAGPFPNGATCTVHTAANKVIGGPEGMVFDNLGRLYVLAGWNTADAGIYQINPTNCLVINSNVGFDNPANELDGLTFDASTNRLFATSSGIGGSNAVYSIDPTTLAAVKIATVPSPDGIINDQHGTLYVASRTGSGVGQIYSVNETTLVATPLTQVPNIDDLGIVPPGPPTGQKTFTPPTVPNGTPSLVTITLTNPNAGTDLLGVNFTDTLPSGVVVANPPGQGTTCGTGAFNPVPSANATTVTFSNLTLLAGTSCNVTFNVVDNNAAATVSTNCVVANSTNGGSDQGPQTVASGRCATLTVSNVVPPTGLPTTKAFGAGSVSLNGTTTMTITITNPAPNGAATNITLIDNFLPTAPGLVVANTPNASTTCGGTVTAVAGATGVSLSGGSLAAGTSSCTITVNVTGITPGIQTNNTSQGTASVSGTTVTVGTSSAKLTVNAPSPVPPVIAKSFSDANVPVFGTTTLTFLITNPNATTLSGITYTDTLPVGLVVATPNGLVGSCDGGTITAVAGTNVISLGPPGASATLLGGGSCTFSVNVTAVLAGPQVNQTTAVTSTEAGNGNTAIALLNVDPPPDAYQIDYLPNVRVNGVVDLSNAGSLGADPFGPLSGTTGRICANVYTFSPDEQEISCCSCLITPNALMHITAADLIGNTATGVQPDSVVVKLLFTIPGANGGPGTQAGPFTASGCNAAFPFDVTNLAPGGRAWATKFHSPTNPPTTFSVTETEFRYNPIRFGQFGPVNNPPVLGEINKLTTLCRFIVGNQSGAGLCKACALGGIGAGKQ